MSAPADRWAIMDPMNVVLRNPRRELTVPGPVRVDVLLGRLSIERETVLVIVDGTLVPGDALIADDAVVEIRSVISGGAW
jgi:sulfur carrier protein ThiS